MDGRYMNTLRRLGDTVDLNIIYEKHGKSRLPVCNSFVHLCIDGMLDTDHLKVIIIMVSVVPTLPSPQPFCLSCLANLLMGQLISISSNAESTFGICDPYTQCRGAVCCKTVIKVQYDQAT
jgi:hypothetical protein